VDQHVHIFYFTEALLKSPLTSFRHTLNH